MLTQSVKVLWAASNSMMNSVTIQLCSCENNTALLCCASEVCARWAVLHAHWSSHTCGQAGPKLLPSLICRVKPEVTLKGLLSLCYSHSIWDLCLLSCQLSLRSQTRYYQKHGETSWIGNTPAVHSLLLITCDFFQNCLAHSKSVLLFGNSSSWTEQRQGLL